MSDKHLNYTSCFDIIGPIMIGPSSSHTAGACAIGRAVNLLFGEVPAKVQITYYESFAETHQGHGTDYALIAGLMGMEAADERVPESLDIAKEKGMDYRFIESSAPSPAHHANTAYIEVWNHDRTHHLIVLGVSIGGGAIELRLINDNGLEVKPLYTTNLIVLKSNHELEDGRLDERFKQLGVHLTNGQMVFNGEEHLFIFNTERHLTDDEFEQLTEGLDLAHQMMLP